MGSSWRYRHVAITPYSIGGFHGLAHTFFMGLLVLFNGLAFCFDEFTRRWKTTDSHRSKQKNKSTQLASFAFSQHFPTKVSPHYIQLDPIYYAYHLSPIFAEIPKGFVFYGVTFDLCRFCTFLNSAQLAGWAKLKYVQNLHKSNVTP